MAWTIYEGFSKFKQDLEITNLQDQTVSDRQQNIRAVIETEMAMYDSFLTGSYRRSTMVAPLSEADIDIFIVLNTKYYSEYGQQGLLSDLMRVLKNTYSRTPAISPNGQAVTIKFSDFEVDVVPGFYRSGGGYLIPDSTQRRWISTDPKKHIELWSEANNSHSGDLVPLIKMIKTWNKTLSVPLRSFHLECMIREILVNVTITNFSSGCRYIFDHLRAKINAQIIDPAGYGGDVGSYLGFGEKFTITMKINSAFTTACNAEQYERIGNTEHAFAMWREIFGDYFPAYG